MKKNVNGILLIYYSPKIDSAPTIMQHVGSFKKHSRFKVRELNVRDGFPSSLFELNFSIIILHYSLFGRFPFLLSNSFTSHISQSKESCIIAFFQDEMQYCQQRFDLINSLKVDIIFSCLEPKYFKEVYYKNTCVKTVLQTFTGYVDDSLIEKAKDFYIKREKRSIDVGYRTRDLPFFLGKGAREKIDIAHKFVRASKSTGLVLDISTSDDDRIHGDSWFRFIANCKFMIGVMSGSSIFDLTGDIRSSVNQYLFNHPGASFEEVETNVLSPYEEKINYRAISPRIFECAASKTCMIMFRDNYQGVLIAGRNFILLEKDFSNYTQVLEQIKNKELVNSIVENTYKDIILSGKYHFKKFIGQFDDLLTEHGYTIENEQLSFDDTVDSIINKDQWIRNILVSIKNLRHINFPGREILKGLIKKIKIK
jgi:hypothetical protein